MVMVDVYCLEKKRIRVGFCVMRIGEAAVDWISTSALDVRLETAVEGRVGEESGKLSGCSGEFGFKAILVLTI